MQGAIFDLDGTILDSMPFWKDVVNIYMKKHGKTVTDEEREEIDRLSITKATKFIKNTYGLSETPEEIEKDILDIIEANYKFNIPLKPYVHLLLTNLKKRGIKMCIASATPAYLIEHALLRHNISDFFDFIITVPEVGAGKNESAKIYEKALKRLETPKEETYIFEDTLHAVKTAKSGGFFVVGIQDAASKAHRDEIEAECDLYIKNFREFINFKGYKKGAIK